MNIRNIPQKKLKVKQINEEEYICIDKDERGIPVVFVAKKSKKLEEL